jgi:hypothetical protein
MLTHNTRKIEIFFFLFKIGSLTKYLQQQNGTTNSSQNCIWRTLGGAEKDIENFHFI